MFSDDFKEFMNDTIDISRIVETMDEFNQPIQGPVIIGSAKGIFEFKGVSDTTDIPNPKLNINAMFYCNPGIDIMNDDTVTYKNNKYKVLFVDDLVEHLEITLRLNTEDYNDG